MSESISKSKIPKMSMKLMLGIAIFSLVNLAIVVMAIMLFSKIYELHASGKLPFFQLLAGLIVGISIGIAFFLKVSRSVNF